MPLKFYDIQAKGKKKAQIYVYRRIGASFFEDGVSAEEFVKELEALGKLDEINLRIDSLGGSPFVAATMYNALRRNGARVIADVDGLAASAASILYMAGDVRRMASNASVMVHNPMGDVGMAYATEFRAAADRLDKIRETMLDTYVRATGMKEKAIGDLMDAEAWMLPAEAVANGFAHEITEEMRMAACLEPELIARYKNMPPQIRARFDSVVDFQPTPNEKIAQMRAKLNAQRL
ncbi:MAG TPA: head maturation protease, ClpP-related [Burkholderiales bacterium]